MKTRALNNKKLFRALFIMKINDLELTKKDKKLII